MAQLKPAERKLFEDPNLCAVSTLGRDGGPRVTMAWVDVDGDDILLNSAQHRGWPKNLQRDPRIGLCVFDRKVWERNVSLVGMVKDMTTVGGWEHIQKVARIYGRSEYRGATDRVIIRVEVLEVHAYGL